MLSFKDWLWDIHNQQYQKHGQHGGFTHAEDWVNSLSNWELLEQYELYQSYVEVLK